MTSLGEKVITFSLINQLAGGLCYSSAQIHWQNHFFLNWRFFESESQGGKMAIAGVLQASVINYDHKMDLLS